ncbi:MAG: hypothetical protein IKH77_03020 [Clostridia bacterium]|nr:hypothetical protein [Clostridia bacterium]
MRYNAYYAARDIILDFVVRDAFGPICKDETLQEPPLDTYVCGILWPKKTPTGMVCTPPNTPAEAGEEQSADSDSGTDLEDEVDDVIREANQFRPSVMALSFALPDSERTIDVSFTCARYENIDRPVPEKKYTLHDYSRVALDSGIMSIDLPPRRMKKKLFGDLVGMQIVRRHQLPNHHSLWTISIENTQNASQNEIDQNTSALFQCSLIVRGTFVPIDDSTRTSGDEDRAKMDFLYRNTHRYGAGHGCSAAWDTDAEQVVEISSTFLPKAIVFQMIAVTDTESSCFKMEPWKDSFRDTGLAELSAYIQRYALWADTLREQLPHIPKSYRLTAEDILAKIGVCITRLKAGVETLHTSDTAWTAFCLTNRAMMRQSAKRRHQPESEVSWYPFQLCYVLMCIPDIVDIQSPWRDSVDLLWFPTGGGKTEAYLGVATFTIFYRRLTKGEIGRGITVLMRYTLRMLTSQQFERAAALICECDLIRREEHLPGGEISIGLWVGSEVTPNHAVSDNPDSESAETVLEKLKSGLIDEVKTSPVQLSDCPYCGTRLDPQTAFSVVQRHFKARCPSTACPFHDDLPVVTVDDDIYDRKPTLLIGTIDKFARLAWEEKTKSLFAEDGIGLPPELLIQDELHLISGPLGSISGLYEIAIEKLIAQHGVRPKILASTATLCNASGQIQALYGKKAFQFPPSGFDADDSFFARSASPDERPQRMYLGYCETGGSLSDAIVRTFGTVKFALQYLECLGIDDSIIDQFWTNVGYFNALKDLGSADTLIIDRVCAYAESLRRHKFADDAARVDMTPISTEYEYGELTSRKNAREILEVRNQLDKEHYPSPAALNYVLSSNMLSVGIDINRLGLMTVYGQPKSTSEYIQATSRVGRSNPGLVIVLLHMLRTRDKSHFEQFQSYHQALNKMVEPTSATPYACRTLDKALHAVFVTMIRHLCPDLSKNQDASKFRESSQAVRSIRDDLIALIRLRSSETADYAEEILDEFIYMWDRAAALRGSHFQYQLLNRSENDTDALLIPAERSDDAAFPPTMNSMRNVDTQSGVYLKRRM